MNLAEIRENLSVLDDWEDRYRFIIDLGRALPALPPEAYAEQHKVRGCASQVWLLTETGPGADPVMSFRGDSDALIVKGLIALVLAFYSGRTASAVLAGDAAALFTETGLKQHLSLQRSNGLASMVKRIRDDAARASSRT